MFRKILKGFAVLGLLMVGAGGSSYYRASYPETWSLDESLQRIDIFERKLVAIEAVPEFEHRRYGMTGCDATQERPQLGTRSPARGVCLIGRDAVSREEWSSLVGSIVWAETNLDVERDTSIIGSGPRLATTHRIIPVTIDNRHPLLPDTDPVSGRRILAYVGSDLWVLAPTSLAISGHVDSLHIVEADWAESTIHRGVLHRIKDFPIDAEVDVHVDATDWLIDEGHELQFTQHTGFHVYIPVAGTKRRIWVQVPLERIDDWKEQGAKQLTGVWLPTQRNEFVEESDNSQPDGVAILQWGDWARQQYIDDQATPFRIGLILGGVGLVLLSGLVLFITAPVKSDDGRSCNISAD